ncbi:hydroxyacylglutathione hydrolase [Salinisphaera orenii]|uniref:hydroxyacylglutathione hydrolase n=1 Tax=Salinisphaera orenii TaxID=856731 RepID=UPI000DBE334F
MNVVAVPVLSDNYVWIAGSGPVIVVDPGAAGPVADYLQQHELDVAAYFITHHHGDHIGGLVELSADHPAPIYAPAEAANQIGRVDYTITAGDQVRVDALGVAFDVIGVPGHTLGHVAFHGEGVLFCGDALFRAGCGRVFEGRFDQMRAGLARLRQLPDDTAVCGGHEYTEKNLAFAAKVEPDNEQITRVQQMVATSRAHGEPSLPGRLDEERAINPFLRWDQPHVTAAAAARDDIDTTDADAVFASIRRWKDAS